MLKQLALIGMVCLLALAGCGGDDDPTPSMDPVTPDVDYAMRWWNALTPEQMVAALFGDEATAEQTAAAQMMYADLDDATKALVNAAAAEIYDADTDYASVGDWWETLDCRLMRVAAGDGITADPMSPYCAHYPGSGSAKILSAEAKAHVDKVGMALLYRDDPGLFVPYVGRGRHGIGTTLEYVRVREDGTTEPASALEYTMYEMYRGGDVLVVQDSNPHKVYPCPTAYWDLATGNRVACFDEDGALIDEWIPHTGTFAFPMAVGMRDPSVYGYRRPGDENCEDVCEGVSETWTVEECGIELEVQAGTFTVCRQSATASWDENLVWIEWYDPERNLQVKTRYDDSWNDLEMTELSSYDLTE